MPKNQTAATVSEHAHEHPAPTDIASRVNLRILPGGTAISDPVPEGEEENLELALDERRNDQDTVNDPSAPPAARAAAHKRLQPFMAREDHEKLGRRMPACGWKDARTRALAAPRTLRATRDTRRTTVSRVCAFSAGPKQSGADDDGPGGDPPDAAGLAASIARFGPQHAARLEPAARPASARPSDLLWADDYLSATLTRLIGRAR